MPPAEIELTHAARRDLSQIAAQLEEDSSARTAGRWVRRLETRILKLRDFPTSGAEDDRLGPGRRRLVVRPYLIIYRLVRPDLLRVIRVVHGARDVTALLPKD